MSSLLTLAGCRDTQDEPGNLARTTFADKHQRRQLEGWHDVLSHIDPVIKHPEKCRLIDVSDTTVTFEIRCSVYRLSKSEALSYGRGGRSPRTLGELVSAEAEASFRVDVMGMKYFQFSTDEASRDQDVIGLETQGSITDATEAYIYEMARERVAIKCASGDGAGELGLSVELQRMLTDRGIIFPVRSQSGGVPECAIK